MFLILRIHRSLHTVTLLNRRRRCRNDVDEIKKEINILEAELAKISKNLDMNGFKAWHTKDAAYKYVRRSMVVALTTLTTMMTL
jgi:L-lactate utilization protein LutB